MQTINWHLLLVISARSKTLRNLADIYSPQNSQGGFTFTPTHISYHNYIAFSKNISCGEFVSGPQAKNYSITACLCWEVVNIFSNSLKKCQQQHHKKQTY